VLGVDEDAIQVEDDGLDHSETYPWPTYTRAGPPRPTSACVTSPTKRV
jgi:hypothetical protein